MNYPNIKDIIIPEVIVEKWQNIVDVLVEITGASAGLITKIKPPIIEVFSSSQSPDNPYNIGDHENLNGLYCEKVFQSDDKLVVTNALEDEYWNNNPSIDLGMISYLGFPLKWSDGDFFGTLCVLNTTECKYSEKLKKNNATIC